MLDMAPPVFLRFVNPVIQLRYALLASSEAPDRPPQPKRNCPVRFRIRDAGLPRETSGDQENLKEISDDLFCLR